MLFSHLVENKGLRAPPYSDSIGVEAGSLPAGVGILDIDCPQVSSAVLQALEESGDALSIEKTPSGGLHIWGVGDEEDLPKRAAAVGGFPLEYFKHGRKNVSFALVGCCVSAIPSLEGCHN